MIGLTENAPIGFQIAIFIGAGAIIVVAGSKLAFVADRIGVFAVELEASGYLLFELDVG